MVTVTKYVWDPVFDCVTHELDENNNVKAEYHNEPQPYGGVLSQRRGTTSHYHHHDALGSTRFLTDSSGNVTDTYLHDAWGNLVASTGTTTNPFKWVGKYGYYTDNSTAQVYVRARMYQPIVARWTKIDPFPLLWTRRNRYAYTSSSPVLRIDRSGLVDCYCKGQCTFKKGAAGGQHLVNKMVLNAMINAYRRLGILCCPLSPQQETDLAKEIRDSLGSDSPNSYADHWLFDVPVITIEQRLHDQGESYGIVRGPIKQYLGSDYITADCMPITCGGKNLCIGTDKIGHFFQQGYMGYELTQSRWVDAEIRAFFEWTEGLPLSTDGTPGGDEIRKWLENGGFPFYRFDEQSLSEYEGKWGQIQRSHADVEANLAGTRFYSSNVGKFCKCIMSFARGERPNPDNPADNCFDICDYITPSWEE